MQRVCLVGAGFISHVHAEAIRGLPALQLHAVVDEGVVVNMFSAVVLPVPVRSQMLLSRICGQRTSCAVVTYLQRMYCSTFCHSAQPLGCQNTMYSDSS